MRAPAHLRGNPRRLLLRRWANGLRVIYGSPVYLVGSALQDDNSDPRDWDVRIALPDRLFAIRYASDGSALGRTADVIERWTLEGTTGQWTRLRNRWADDCCKKAREGSRQTFLNIDFQVYPLSHCRTFYADRPRYRLDRWRS